MPERGQHENLDRHLQDNRGLDPMEQNRRIETFQNDRDLDSIGQQIQQPQEERSISNDNTEDGSQRKGTSNRGFAAMDPERQRRIASEGGRAAHRQGVAHEWNRDEAREAGRKGGQKVSQNREHMSEIGRKGGQRSGSRRSRSDNEQ